MDHFTAHRLRFECEVVTPLRLNSHTGSAIRGAFYHALWNQFCMNHEVLGCVFREPSDGQRIDKPKLVQAALDVLGQNEGRLTGFTTPPARGPTP